MISLVSQQMPRVVLGTGLHVLPVLNRGQQTPSPPVLHSAVPNRECAGVAIHFVNCNADPYAIRK